MSCTSLKTVSIGNSVTSIPTGCFYSCPSLIEANLPDGLAKIGTEAFFGCPSLKITIPDSVTEIGPYALGMQADARTGQIVKSQNFLMTTGCRLINNGVHKFTKSVIKKHRSKNDNDTTNYSVMENIFLYVDTN
jgi:hypothetical protein